MNDSSITRVPGSRRIGAIDAARGAAMLLVFFSHFGEVYFATASRMAHVTQDIGRIATPTFVIISGIMAGYLLRSRPQDFLRIRYRLQARGLFFLVVGHLIVTISQVPRAGGWLAATHC